MSEQASDTPNKKRKKSDDDLIVIKKYANRRLYNTATSSYVTLDFLSELVKNGQDFVVYDAKTGDDITRPVLTQIIFEQENKGQNLLPVQFLRQLIKFYGDSMQSYVPSYLEMSMDAFSRNQETFRTQLEETMGTSPGYKMFEENIRKNMALYEQAMKMFTTSMPGMTNPMANAMAAGMPPFTTPPAPPTPGNTTGSGPGTRAHTQSDTQTINDLKQQLSALQEKLARMETK